MTEYNPFSEDEDKEKVYVPKPHRKETLTEKQKARNLKGIRKCIEDLKKVKSWRPL